MILVTGGTGFIGGELVRNLRTAGRPFRLLLQPSADPTTLPRGWDFEVAVSSLSDSRGLRAALQGVEVIYHLAGVEQQGSKANLEQLEVSGLKNLTQAASEAHISRFFYLSHLGADRASAYNLLKAKGIAEHIIRTAEIPFSIFRVGPVFGPGDHFTRNIAHLIKISPGIVLLPGKGNTLLQPLWIGDLVTCLLWALEMPETINQTLELGGPEHLTFLEVMQLIAQKTRKRRRFVETNPVQLGRLTQFLETSKKDFPTSVFWLEYLAENRTCGLDSLPRLFGINPAIFRQKLDFLAETRN
jgi:NADH dehydrogenase